MGINGGAGGYVFGTLSWAYLNYHHGLLNEFIYGLAFIFTITFLFHAIEESLYKRMKTEKETNGKL